MTNETPDSAPKIAIVIPVYNRKEDMRLLLKSVFELGYKNFDVIIVDNGSTDNVQQITETYPDVQLLKKDRNYGATVGFNTGLEYAASSGLYKYVWMMDSDLIVEPDCLGILVDIIERDDKIGIVGPKILNSHNRELIVEIGANIDLASGQVHPFYCNEPDIESTQPFDVDYLGSGISLIRVQAYKKVGPMDERYFFLWDDMDYGLAMNNAGYKVVAAPHAVVLHPPFTEKRSVWINAYYGIRSPMLTVSKYADYFSRLKYFYGMLRTVFKGTMFRFLSGYGNLAVLSLLAIKNFVLNKWGELEDFNRYKDEDSTRRKKQIELESCNFKSVVILPSGTKSEIDSIIGDLSEKISDAQVIAVVQENRKNLFDEITSNELIVYNDKSKNLLLEHLSTFYKLLSKRYDAAINPYPERGSPFTYAFPRVLDWDQSTGAYSESGENIYSVWKLIVSVILGELFALIALPVVYFSSFKYKSD